MIGVRLKNDGYHGGICSTGQHVILFWYSVHKLLKVVQDAHKDISFYPIICGSRKLTSHRRRGTMVSFHFPEANCCDDLSASCVSSKFRCFHALRSGCLFLRIGTAGLCHFDGVCFSFGYDSSLCGECPILSCTPYGLTYTLGGVQRHLPFCINFLIVIRREET